MNPKGLAFPGLSWCPSDREGWGKDQLNSIEWPTDWLEIGSSPAGPATGLEILQTTDYLCISENCAGLEWQHRRFGLSSGDSIGRDNDADISKSKRVAPSVAAVAGSRSPKPRAATATATATSGGGSAGSTLHAGLAPSPLCHQAHQALQARLQDMPR